MTLVTRFAWRGGKDRPHGGGGHRRKHAVEPQGPSDHHQWLIAPPQVGSVEVTREAVRPRPFEEVEFAIGEPRELFAREEHVQHLSRLDGIAERENKPTPFIPFDESTHEPIRRDSQVRKSRG